MIEGVLSGFAVALSPVNVLFVALGVLIGTVVGLLPGLGPLAAIALLLPLTYTLDPSTAIIFLAGVYYGSMFGGRIPAILLNLPGDSSSVVTTFDGFPLARQGRAGAALSITAIGSFLGGTFAILLLTFFAGFLSQWAVKMGPPELFALTIFGLMMIVLITSGSAIKGLLAAAIGMLLAIVGTDAITGTQRLSFDRIELMGGIHIVPLAVGLFGIAEILVDTETRYFRDPERRKVTGLWPTAADWVTSRWAILRASIVGFLIGVLPGGGGTVSSVVAYGVEKRFSRHPEKFGKGAMDGLAATETADNASSNSAFIPLLTLGIPPNPVLALLAGALILHNVTPGPQLIQEHPDVFWGVIASMYIGSIFLLILNLPLIRVFIRILDVPAALLTAIILSLAVYGVYSVRNSTFDVLLMFLFGLVGYAFRKAGVSAGVLIIGFILAPIMESHFRRSMIMSSGSLDIFVTRPVSAVVLGMVALLALSLSLPALRRLAGRQTRYRQ